VTRLPALLRALRGLLPRPAAARAAGTAGTAGTARAAAYAALGRRLAEQDARTLAARRAADAAARAALGRTRAADDAPLWDDADRPVRLRVPGVADQERLTPPVGQEIIRQAANRNRRFNFCLAAMLAPALLVGGLLAGGARSAGAQDVRIRDLTLTDGAAPIRLVGYGLAVGLDNSGDRSAGRGGMTVQSVVNLLRNFNVEVPTDLVRTRNAAAVLVTAEVSPYLRAGGRFDVHVASLGDARSLRGGVLYMTPLVAEAGGRPVAGAQGSLLLSDGVDPRQRYGPPAIETAARVPGGGQLEADLPRPTLAQSGRLLLKEPDLATATRIATAVNAALGANTATVEDPGAVTLALPAAGRAAALARVGELAVRPARAARVVIDVRDGTVVAGGDLAVGEAVVSHGAVTLNIGGGAEPQGPATTAPAAGATADAPPGDVRVTPGSSVQKVAAALHAVQTPASDIAAIFAALRDVGALAADVVVR
jgi:flagellar P-ring protein precursor FlgI